jgi:hypothetical protein
MEQRLQESRKTVPSESVQLGPEIARPRFSSLENWILRKTRRFLFNLCDGYFWFHGFREIQFPSVTIILPVAGRTERLAETIKSLLAARYSELYIAVVWLGRREESFEEESEHPNIRFYTAKPGVTKAEAIREILFRTAASVFAWLEAGDGITPNVLEQVGKLFLESPKLSGVLVPELHFPTAQSVPKSIDFSFLWTQSFSFGIKLFARRECLWGAGEAFAGTDYDCNDWAVALNSSRFSKIKMISDGFWVAGQSTPDATSTEGDLIRLKIGGSMWWTERLRRSAVERLVRVITSLYPSKSKTGNKAEESSFVSAFRLSKDCENSPSSSVLTESLLGFSAGVESEFRGSYQWCFADREPIARKVFSYRKTGTLLFEPITIAESNQARGETLKIQVDAVQERSAILRAKGVGNLIAALPEALEAQLRRKVRIAPVSLPTHNPPGVSSAEAFDRRIEPRQWITAACPPPDPEQADSQIIGLESPFDILVLQRSLDTVQKPLTVFRNAANYLKRDGWLIVACSTYITDPFADWQRPKPILSTDCKMIFSQNALIDLVRVAGFETKRLIGLSDKELENFGSKIANAFDWIRTVGSTLFDAGQDRISSETYVLLACQRKF